MKPGVARWALQQSVWLSPIKLICPAPYDCTPPAVSFLREIALALNYTNLNISSCPFFSPTASQRFQLQCAPVVQISQESHLNIGFTLRWLFCSRALHGQRWLLGLQKRFVSSRPNTRSKSLKEEIIKCCCTPRWPSRDGILVLFSTPSRRSEVQQSVRL